MSKLENFRKNLETCLQKHGAQTELADAADVSRGFINDVLKGRKNPSLDVAVRMCDVLGVSIEQMLRLPSDFNQYRSKLPVVTLETQPQATEANSG